MARARRKFVSVVALGVRPVDDSRPEIMLAIYGPRGGTCANEALSVEAATRLRDDLSTVLAELEAEQPQDPRKG